MADDKTTQSRSLPPVTVTAVTTGDASRLSDLVIETPGTHQPNLIVQAIPPLLALAVRFAKTFGVAWLGIVTGAMSSTILPFTDFQDLAVKACGLSLAGAVVGLVKDLITVFGRLEQKYPLLTGNV